MYPPQEKNWWQKNWKWLVPVCGGGSLVLLAGLVALIMGTFWYMTKSSEAYKSAIAQVQTNQVVQEAIGTPIEAGMFFSGDIHLAGSSGTADLVIPISGPKGKATLYVVAEKSAGRWTFEVLVVEIKETKQRIDLLDQRNGFDDII